MNDDIRNKVADVLNGSSLAECLVADPVRNDDGLADYLAMANVTIHFIGAHTGKWYVRHPDGTFEEVDKD